MKASSTSRKAAAKQAREDRQILELGKIVAVHLEAINAQCAGNTRKLDQLRKKRAAMLAKLEPWQVDELRLVGMVIEKMAIEAQ